jgi:hypothetical protein
MSALSSWMITVEIQTVPIADMRSGPAKCNDGYRNKPPIQVSRLNGLLSDLLPSFMVAPTMMNPKLGYLTWD